MKLRTKKALTLAVGMVGMQLASRAYAQTHNFTWTGAVSNDISNNSNWSSAPAFHDSSGTGTSLVFDPILSSTTNVTPNLPNSLGLDIVQLQFSPGAPAETFTGDGTFSLSQTGFQSIINNSGVTQTFNNAGVTCYASSTTSSSISATSGNIVINGLFHASADSANTSRFSTFGGASDVSLLGGITSANAASPTVGRIYYNGTGHLILGNSSTTYGGNITANSGVIRATDPNSFGSSVGSTSINGTSALELATGVGNSASYGETFSFATRSDATTSHLVNVSGANTISAPMTYSGGTVGNNVIFESKGTAAGDLLTISGGFAHSSVGNQNLILKGAGNGVFSGAITATSGDWDIVKQGGGTWTLTSPGNNVDGTTTVQAGTLALGQTGGVNATLITKTIDVQNGGTFDVSGMLPGGFTPGNSQTLKGTGVVTGAVTAGGISGAGTISPGETAGVGSLNIRGALSLSGGSTLAYRLSNTPGSGNDDLVVTGDISLSGTTNIAVTKLNTTLTNGSYHLIDYTGSLLSGNQTNFSLTGAGGGGTSRQAIALNTSVAHQITLDVSGGSAANLTWVGSANAKAWDVVTTVNWTGATDGDNRFYNGDFVNFTDSGSSNSPVNLAVSVNPSTMTFSNSTGHDYSVTGANNITTTGDFTASGSGNVTIGNAALNVGGNLTASGAGNLTLSNTDLLVTGNLIQSGTGTVTIANTGSIGITGGIAINSGTVSLVRGDNVTIGNTITGAGAFQKDGLGIATLSGNNSAYTGPVVVANGTLKAGGANALGSGGATVKSGATLDLYGAALTTEGVTISGTGASGQRGALVDTRAIGSSAISQINSLTLAGDSTICVQNMTVGSTITGSFMFLGAGTNQFVQGNGHNLYVTIDTNCEIDMRDDGPSNLGNVTLDGGGGANGGTAGSFYIGGTTDLGSTGVLTVEDSAKFGMYASNAVNTKPIVIATTGSGIAGLEFDSGNDNPGNIQFTTLGSNITLNGNLDYLAYHPVDGVRSLSLSGVISGAGSIGLHALSAGGARVGILALTNDSNSFTGGITIGGGGGFNNVAAGTDQITLSIGNGGTTGSLGSGPVDVEGTLQFNKNTAYTVPNNISGNGLMTFVASGQAVKLTGTNDNFFGQLVVKAGTVELASSAQITTLENFSNGADIQKGRLLLDYTGSSPAGTVNDYLKASYAASNGTKPHFQQLPFIDSTNTATTALGEYDNGTAIIVGKTIFGDANLDGVVNALDFNALATDYGNTSNPLWYQGDYNYDGSVDSNDFALLAANFGMTFPTGSDLVSDSATAASLGTLVPEPTSLGLLSIAGIVAMRRRARR